MTNREDLMERSPVPMAELEGPHHIMRYVNPAFCRLHGKSKAALTGKPFAETMEDKNRCLALVERVYLTGEPETQRYILRSGLPTGLMRCGRCWMLPKLQWA